MADVFSLWTTPGKLILQIYGSLFLKCIIFPHIKLKRFVKMFNYCFAHDLSTYLIYFGIDIYIHSLIFYSYDMDIKFVVNCGKTFGYWLPPPYSVLSLTALIKYRGKYDHILIYIYAWGCKRLVEAAPPHQHWKRKLILKGWNFMAISYLLFYIFLPGKKTFHEMERNLVTFLKT